MTSSSSPFHYIFNNPNNGAQYSFSLHSIILSVLIHTPYKIVLMLSIQTEVMIFVCVQLEKVIGKLKTEKYGNRILQQIEKYSDSELTDKQETDGRAAKRSKTKKNLVLIESSEDEEEW